MLDVMSGQLFFAKPRQRDRDAGAQGRLQGESATDKTSAAVEFALKV